ncbi:MFS transporter [Corynebacterium halotolerans]|uniref:MFS transporter n=1 Tax=Corynebacterium halotolerans TaxID=225326 RepID=UPI003CECBAE5
MRQRVQGVALREWVLSTGLKSLFSYRPSRAAYTAGYLMVVLTIGAYLPTPLYPVYQAQLGFSDLALTLVYSVFPLVSAVALLLFGPASDMVGRRAVLRIAVLLGALGSLSFLAADGLAWLFLGRALQGVALGAATGAATALIVDQAPIRHRRWTSALATVAFLAGTALGPVLGGALAQYLPAPGVVPYVLHLLTLVLGWQLASRLSSATPAAGRLAGWRLSLPRIPAAIKTPFHFSAVVGFLAWTVVGIFLSTVPSVLERSAGITNVATIGSILAALLAFAMAMQPLIPLLDARRAQIMGLIGLLLSLVVLGMQLGASLLLTLLSAAIAGCGVGLAYGGSAAEVDAITAPEQRGGVNAALYLAYYLGSGVPAVVLGLLSLRVGMTDALAVLVAIIAVATGGAWYISRFVPRAHQVDTML